jgi:hypothetical protein
MKADANKNATTARNLGATADTMAKQKAIVLNTFNKAVVFTSPQLACNELIGTVARKT